MGSSSAVSIAGHSASRIHQIWNSVECGRLTKETQREFAAVIGSAKRGSKPEPLAQMSKDIGSGQNHLARTLNRYTLGLQAIDVDVDKIAEPMENFLARLRSLRAPAHPMSVRELLALDHRLECELNPFQWDLADDPSNGWVRRHVIERLRKALKNGHELLARLEKEESDEIARRPQ